MKRFICILCCTAFLLGCAAEENKSSSFISDTEMPSLEGSASISSGEIESDIQESSPDLQNSESGIKKEIRSYNSVLLMPLSGSSAPVEVHAGDEYQGFKVESLRYEEILLDGEWQIYTLEIVFSGEYVLSGTYYYQGGMDYFVPEDTSDLPVVATFPLASLRLSSGKEYWDLIDEKGYLYHETGEAVKIPISKLVISDYIILTLYESGASPYANVVSMEFAE